MEGVKTLKERGNTIEKKRGNQKKKPHRQAMLHTIFRFDSVSCCFYARKTQFHMNPWCTGKNYGRKEICTVCFLFLDSKPEMIPKRKEVHTQNAFTRFFFFFVI